MSAEAIPKHPPNRLETSYIEAARGVEAIVSEWDKQDVHVKLLKALCRLTMNQNSAMTNRFTTADLANYMRKSGLYEEAPVEDPRNESGEQSRFIVRHWNKLQRTWTERKEGVNQKLGAQGINLKVDLGKTAGGGKGRRSHYFLQFEASSRAKDSPELPVVPTAGVGYFTEEISPDKKDKWYFQILLIGWKAKFIVGVFLVLCLLFVGLMLFFFMNVVLYPSSVEKTISAIFSTGLLGFVLWSYIKPFSDLINNRIIIAPFWLQPWDATDRLIELRRQESEKANAVHLTRYSAECPLCGGKLKIDSGGREFYGRLVGRCSKSPNEHVYSFDHTLRVGRPLR